MKSHIKAHGINGPAEMINHDLRHMMNHFNNLHIQSNNSNTHIYKKFLQIVHRYMYKKIISFDQISRVHIFKNMFYMDRETDIISTGILNYYNKEIDMNCDNRVKNIVNELIIFIENNISANENIYVM